MDDGQSLVGNAAKTLTEARAAIAEHEEHVVEDNVRRACVNLRLVVNYVDEVLTRIADFRSVEKELHADAVFVETLTKIQDAANKFLSWFATIVSDNSDHERGRAPDETHLALCRDLYAVSHLMLGERDKMRNAVIAVVAGSFEISNYQKTELRFIGDVHPMTIDDVRGVLRRLTETAKEWRKRFSDIAVDQTCNVADLAARFVEDVCSVEQIGEGLRHALDVDFAFRLALTNLGEIAPVVDSALTVVVISPYVQGDSTGAAEADFASHRDRLRAQERVFRGRLGQARAAYADVLDRTKERGAFHPPTALKISQRLLVDLGVFNNRDDSEDRAEKAAERAEEASEKAELAAGRAGSENLAAAFEEYTEEQRKLAAFFRRATMALLGAFVVAAFIVVVFIPEPTTLELLEKLTVAIPASVLIAYTGRESARHQAEARWARELAMKLRTLPAYTASLKLAEQRIFRRDLGVQVFAIPRKSKDDEPPPAGIYGELVTVLGKVAEILKSRTGPDEKDSGGDGGKKGDDDP